MIEFSARESELFKLRFGRATIDSDFPDWQEIKKKISDLRLDYLRVKVTNPDKDFISKLSRLSSHVYLTGSIRLYKIKTERPPAPYLHSDILFKKVIPSERNKFKQLILSSYTDFPMGYHQYPELAQHFPLDIQRENISSYLAEQYDGSHSDMEGYIGYINDKPVGCFTADVNDPSVTVSSYIGIPEDQRSKGIFRDILKCLGHVCVNRGAKEFIGGGRLENLSSQHGIEKENGICYGYELVYMIGFGK